MLLTQMQGKERKLNKISKDKPMKIKKNGCHL